MVKNMVVVSDKSTRKEGVKLAIMSYRESSIQISPAGEWRRLQSQLVVVDTLFGSSSKCENGLRWLQWHVAQHCFCLHLWAEGEEEEEEENVSTVLQCNVGTLHTLLS